MIVPAKVAAFLRKGGYKIVLETVNAAPDSETMSKCSITQKYQKLSQNKIQMHSPMKPTIQKPRLRRVNVQNLKLIAPELKKGVWVLPTRVARY